MSLRDLMNSLAGVESRFAELAREHRRAVYANDGVRELELRHAAWAEIERLLDLQAEVTRAMAREIAASGLPFEEQKKLMDNFLRNPEK